jgi:hypothetical protein
MSEASRIERMRELGTRHSTLEARGELEPLLATLVAEPVYEFHPLGLCMRGGETVRRFYSQFCQHFLPLRHSYALLGEWVGEDAVVQEYDVSLKVDGEVETHRVIGILYGDSEGRLLAGERVYASERFVRLMTGELFDELLPLARD